MKMLLVVDTEKYSTAAAYVAAKMAINTWADVTILGIQEEPLRQSPTRLPLLDSLYIYQHFFTSAEETPYQSGAPETVEQVDKGLWKVKFFPPCGQKKLELLIRKGDLQDEILKQVDEDQTDFLVMGCANEGEFQWNGMVNLPEKIANKAPCNILIVKKREIPKSVVVCLDHDYISQESLEIINQLVTIFQAELTIVGIIRPKGLKENVQEKMNQVLQYYTNLNVRAWIRLVEEDSLSEFIANASKKSIVGLWLGKKTFLQKIFSKDRIGQLINTADSLVLILK